jgi:xylulokinase
MMRDLVIGIDSSTSATKAIAWDRSGGLVAEGRAPISLSNPQSGYFEQEPEEWWHSTVSALNQLTSRIDAGRVAAIGISNQRETFALCTEDGKAVRPGLVWLDDRATEQMRAFGAAFGAGKIHRISGKPLDVIPCLYRMIWLAQHEPGNFRKADRFADVHAFLARRLTGSWISSVASADPTGMLDMVSGQWSTEILAAAGVPVALMPPLARPGKPIGEISPDAGALTGLRPGTPLIAAGGDGQCAGTGAGALSAKQGYINLGTAVVAGIYSPEYDYDRSFRTEVAVAEHGYIYETCLRSGTFLIDWMLSEMMCVPRQERADFLARTEAEAAASPIGADGVMLLPFWQGSMTPHWDSYARGVIAGISGSTRRGDIYRALLEGIALDMAPSLTRASGKNGGGVESYRAIGGGAASDLFLQILADTLDRPIERTETREASSLGAAMAAAAGAGWFPTIRAASETMAASVTRRFEPDSGRVAAYKAWAEVYDELWPLLRRWNQKRSEIATRLAAAQFE